MAKKKLTFDTASKIVTETFLADMQKTSDKNAIKGVLVDAERALRQIMDTEAEDMQLTAARELASDLGKGYKEASKNEHAKIVVCLQRLEDLGEV